METRTTLQNIKPDNLEMGTVSPYFCTNAEIYFDPYGRSDVMGVGSAGSVAAAAATAADAISAAVTAAITAAAAVDAADAITAAVNAAITASFGEGTPPRHYGSVHLLCRGAGGGRTTPPALRQPTHMLP